MNEFFHVPTGGRRVAALCAAVLLLAGVAAEGTNTGSVPMAAAWTVSGFLVLAAVAARPDRFAATAASGVVASCLVTLVNARMSTHAETTFGIIESAALLLVMARAVRQLRPRGAVPLAGGAFAALSAQFLRCDPAEYPDLVSYVVPVLWFAAALATVLGLYLRLLDRYRKRERTAEIQEQRLEYARDLHDFVGHHVTAIIAQTRAVRYTTAAGRPPSPGELDDMLAAIEDAGSQAMRSMRSMVTVLRDPRSPGDRPGTGGMLTELRDLIERFSASGPKTTLALDPRLAGGDLPPGTATTVHQIVREALTNVRKHAGRATAVTVDVRLEEDGSERPTVLVAVTDDGPDADRSTPPTGTPGTGFGLTGLSERAAMVGGTLTAGPRAGVGWIVEARIPLPGPLPDPGPAGDDRAAVTAGAEGCAGMPGTTVTLDT
ncbi:sensor histidine kinase [Streptomyces sp. AC555_RSS877]|uniref:sensor histidine kinase n=1 Tax=Streptomyces sp. AC555_RSS877 TaxID=2823688 RepID=UPI001C27F291|nr:histidine kinase [Streptomyces sp. AC555_RSS877]